MTSEWVRYRRVADRPLEAMHARFERHVYHRHSHDTYSFGVTEDGAQEFTCRGGRHTSAAGMVMAFNPEDTHDGHAADALGFTYRIVHLSPALLTGHLAARLGRPAPAPLFATPVLARPGLAGALRALHVAVMGGAPALVRDERLDTALAALVRVSTRPPREPGRPAAPARRLAHAVRELLHDDPARDPGAEELAALTGYSRFAVYRAFRAEYGMSPGDYQRQLRLRTARDLLASGTPPARAAAACGFADQAHLTRWFHRYFGITPGAYRRAVAS